MSAAISIVNKGTNISACKWQTKTYHSHIIFEGRTIRTTVVEELIGKNLLRVSTYVGERKAIEAEYHHY